MWTRRVFLATTAAALCAADDTPASADFILKAAQAQARDGRVVWVLFHASWCSWCRRLDSVIESEKIRPIVSKYFVLAHVRVDEHDGSKFRDDAGAKELEMRLGGGSAGLPFFAFVKADGELIVNSLDPKGDNIGFSAEPQEIDWFLAMLKKAARAMAPQERAALEKAFRPTSK